MANQDEIKAIELRRLAELEKRRAWEGIETSPTVLLEIADLRGKYGTEATAISRSAGPDLGPVTMRDVMDEIDFLRAVCTSALRRINSVEQQRMQDVFWRNIWLALLTLGLMMMLIRVY